VSGKSARRTLARRERGTVNEPTATAASVRQEMSSISEPLENEASEAEPLEADEGLRSVGER